LAQNASKKGKKAKATQPVKPQIYLCTPIPAFKSSFNINETIIANEIIPIQQEVAKQYGLQVIDFHTLFANEEEKVQSDGIHPNEKGARRMAEIVADVLKK
jgi:lysophospholipase L1-like esterase